MSRKKKIFNKNNSQFVETNVRNDQSFLFYYELLKLLAISRFTYKNLPKSMDETFLEETLFYNSMSSLLKSEKMNFCNTACASSGDFNIYYKPVSLRCFSINFEEYRKLYTGLKQENSELEECVLIYNNKNKTETHSFIEYFAYKLYNVDRNIDININACKTPVIAYGNDKNLLTVQNVLVKYQGNEPIILLDKKVTGDINQTIQTIDLKPQYYGDKLQFQKEKIFNEALTYLGINNISLEKKERLNQDEANSNNEMINLMLNAYLQPREEAINQFNELFNQNVQVVLNSDLENMIKKVKSQIMEYSNFNEKEENL